MEPHGMEYEIMEYERLNATSNVTSDTSTLIQTNELYDQLKRCHETLIILSQGIQTLSNDSSRLNEESLHVNNLIPGVQNELNQMKVSIEKKDTFFSSTALNQEAIQQQLSSIKEIVDEMEFVSVDGTLIWKVTNISEKMADAQSERQTSIYSPLFYSSPTGYKMRARLYLNGDGNARRTHMSLFFVLMRGDYDSLLKWPFNYKITFCLFDQSGQNQHVIDSFRPDTKSNSFQRPRSEMNVASGIPKFFPLSMIQQENNNYVQDNTMFIKVIVDFADFSKMMLPNALSLNPGLPSHVQQHLIKHDFTQDKIYDSRLDL
ncbi:unnamed protein product [Didymodactylos carnosus]|uniref:MATH domain-containing protein n=1 Tax=Didymodactylos carnosus TaxID=1234261 RepID=A0A815USZ1_9BILA|nr:unnamed protein product [Didymodactylos carnosus]CAF4377841.1 unnamed protein product [Didymodactylos carnosus]